jgi:hypothetical protein
MAKKAVGKAKNSKINRATPIPKVDLPQILAEMNDWPRSWMGWEKDIPPGETLIACFRPFLEHLAVTGLSRKTLRHHVDNLWTLGGEIIRDLHETPTLRRKPVEGVLSETVSPDGGPLIHHGSEEQQHSFDATCRKLHRFLNRPHS